MLCEYCLFLLGLFFLPSCVCLETQNMTILSYQYSAEVEGWFKLHRVPATWNDAHTHCLQEGIPLEMISIPFEEKQQCPEELGDWIVLRPSESLDFVSLNDTYPYICYKKNYSETENGYVKDDSTGSYYKFHQKAMNWHNAAQTCAKEAAHLVIINSDEEVTVLKKLFENYPDSSLKTVTNYSGVLLVGMYKWTQPKGWLTLHGQDLNEAGYSKWGKGQPDGTGSCAGMFRSGLLDDLWCSTEKFVFICERTPHEKFDAENLL